MGFAAVTLERASLEVTKEEVRSATLGNFRGDVLARFPLRFACAPQKSRFTLIALLTLTLGLGINCAIFTVVNAVLLRPLPYPNSERLVLVQRIPGDHVSCYKRHKNSFLARPFAGLRIN